jgi:hypothetical protein
MHQVDYITDAGGQPDVGVLNGNDGNGWAVGLFTKSELPLNGQRIYQSTATKISDSNSETVALQSIDFNITDTNSANVNGSVVPFRGSYDFHVQVKFNLSSIVTITGEVKVVPEGRRVARKQVDLDSGNSYLNLRGKARLDTTNHLTIEIFQQSGSGVDTVTGDDTTFFEIIGFDAKKLA